MTFETLLKAVNPDFSNLWTPEEKRHAVKVAKVLTRKPGSYGYDIIFGADDLLEAMGLESRDWTDKEKRAFMTELKKGTP